MTNQDKAALSARLAPLAEAAGLPGELVWEKWTCDKGHPDWRIKPDSHLVTASVGDLCLTCLNEAAEKLTVAQRGKFPPYPRTIIFSDPKYQACVEWNQAYWVNWHTILSERPKALLLSRIPLDLADPAVLLPVVEAWRKTKPKARHYCQESAFYNIARDREDPPEGHAHSEYGRFVRTAESAAVALAVALCAALEAEKGDPA